jgi:DNA-binding FrmR family transcriptional regulator
MSPDLSALAVTVGEVLAAIVATVVVIWRVFHTRMASVDAALNRVLGQVENTHSSNLRDDLDERFDRLCGQLDGLKTDISSIAGRVDRVSTEVEGVRTDVRQMRTEVVSQRQALTDHITTTQ